MPARRAAITVAIVSLLVGEVFFARTRAMLEPLAGQAQAAAGSATPGVDAGTGRALLDRYCIGCHNSRLKTAGLVLDREAIDTANVGAAADVWEKVARKMRSRAMPPAGARRPQASEYVAFTSWVEDALDRAAIAHPNPGRATIHRLNRAEYANAVR